MWNYHYKTFKFDFVGLATLMAVLILKIQGLGNEDVASVLDWIFSIISPTYCLGSGILNVYINYGSMINLEELEHPLLPVGHRLVQTINPHSV
jgi:hypothetical protein